jgi:hypothetical protein
MKPRPIFFVSILCKTVCLAVAYQGILFGGGGGGILQLKLRTSGRVNGDLGAVARWSGVPLSLQMSETCMLIRFLWMYFPQNWEFGSAMLKLWNFRGV